MEILETCPYPARAWWGGDLLAESSAAVEARDLDGRPVLCFPLSDVRLDLFCEEPGPPAGEDGPGRSWSLELPVPREWPAAGGWGGPVPDRDDARFVMRSLESGPSGARPEMVAFDDSRVRVELLDRAPGGTDRDVTAKRFPVWGHASDLIDILDVRPQPDGSFLGVTRADTRRPVVEGSQMLGQAVVAAGRHTPGRRVVSGHMVFMRAADASRPLRFEIDELGSGRTFTTLAAHVLQDGRRCATGTLLLDVTAPDLIRHGASPPAGPGPYQSEPYDMSVMGRDLRVVDAAYTDDPAAPVGPPTIDAWVRFGAVPPDPCIHAGLLAQFTGHMSIAAALRPHAGIGQREAHRTISTAINAIGIAFHSDVRADRWMLYHHESTFAGDGMTHADCRVHDEAGTLLATFTVDAMVRKFPDRAGAVDDRTAL